MLSPSHFNLLSFASMMSSGQHERLWGDSTSEEVWGGGCDLLGCLDLHWPLLIGREDCD